MSRLDPSDRATTNWVRLTSTRLHRPRTLFSPLHRKLNAPGKAPNQETKRSRDQQEAQREARGSCLTHHIHTYKLTLGTYSMYFPLSPHGVLAAGESSLHVPNYNTNTPTVPSR